ncbi:MAG: hypothetical protein R2911_08825 [Caldilineaceae bacterium]
MYAAVDDQQAMRRGQRDSLGLKLAGAIGPAIQKERMVALGQQRHKLIHNAAARPHIPFSIGAELHQLPIGQPRRQAH